MHKINSVTEEPPDEQLSIDPNFLIDASEALNIGDFNYIYSNKTQSSNFKILRTLAKGGYGEVYVVEFNKIIYAMKKVPKHLVIKNKNTTFFMNEKEIMTSTASEWLIKCHVCVQDPYYLYYIMDFIPGGDLMCYLSKIDILKEDEIRFFAAEIFVAINAMHNFGWIHRDLKPDNILIDRDGHIKLGDFGSCIKMVNGQAVSSITVGTPDYVCPDLLVAVGETMVYGPEVDYWTVGVIIYEMLCGTTPFYSNSLTETYSKIVSMEYSFEGCESNVSDELRDLIGRLLCKKEKRIRFVEVKKHQFFKGIDWENLRKIEPFYKPKLVEECDISNFVDTGFVPDNNKVLCDFKEFVGFTYDPNHSKRLLEMITQWEADKSREDGDEKCKKVPSDYTEVLNEYLEIKSRLGDLKNDKERKEAEVEKYNMSLENIVCLISEKKEEYEGLKDGIRTARQELSGIKKEIACKINLLNNADSSLAQQICEDVRDIRKGLNRGDVFEKFEEIKKLMYWMYKKNMALHDELSELRGECEAGQSKKEELKKELRIKRTEIREYQQKVEQEISLRKQLEREILALKQHNRSTVKQSFSLNLSLKNVMNNKKMELVIKEGYFTLNNFPSECLNKNIVANIKDNELVCNLSNIFIRELKNHELHHLPYNRRMLVAVVHFLSEPTRTTHSGGTRRSLKALETDYVKEERILKGLENLIKVLDGVTLKDAIAQKEGSEKKIKELKEEIEKAKKSTITEYEVNDNERVAEFNNHLFYEKTVAKGTLCDYCNEPLYGIIRQAYCCRDCFLVVHKHCYILVDVSCEMYQSMKRGTSIFVACKSTEEKERLIKINKK